MHRTPVRFLLCAIALSAASRAAAQGPIARDSTPCDTVFYMSGPLRIEAYLYRPQGAGPFPVVVYNHGSRLGAERAERPFPYIGRLLTSAGYAVLVPERRGYGKSDGETFGVEVGRDLADRFMARLQAESDDVLASLAYLRTVPALDTARVAVMGWSFGGIISVLAASRSDRFFAVVNQAGASLTWPRSPALRAALVDAAGRVRVPIICMVAENDETTEAVVKVCEAAQAHGTLTKTIVYPPFTPTRQSSIAPGHVIFGPEGVTRWSADVMGFLAAHRPR